MKRDLFEFIKKQNPNDQRGFKKPSTEQKAELELLNPINRAMSEDELLNHKDMVTEIRQLLKKFVIALKKTDLDKLLSENTEAAIKDLAKKYKHKDRAPINDEMRALVWMANLKTQIKTSEKRFKRVEYLAARKIKNNIKGTTLRNILRPQDLEE